MISSHSFGSNLGMTSSHSYTKLRCAFFHSHTETIGMLRCYLTVEGPSLHTGECPWSLLDQLACPSADDEDNNDDDDDKYEDDEDIV